MIEEIIKLFKDEFEILYYTHVFTEIKKTPYKHKLFIILKDPNSFYQYNIKIIFDKKTLELINFNVNNANFWRSHRLQNLRPKIEDIFINAYKIKTP